MRLRYQWTKSVPEWIPSPCLQTCRRLCVESPRCWAHPGRNHRSTHSAQIPASWHQLKHLGHSLRDGKQLYMHPSWSQNTSVNQHQKVSIPLFITNPTAAFFRQQCQTKFNHLLCNSVNISYQRGACTACCMVPHFHLQFQPYYLHCPAIHMDITWFPSPCQFDQLAISSKYQELFLSLEYSTLAAKDLSPAKNVKHIKWNHSSTLTASQNTHPLLKIPITY